MKQAKVFLLICAGVLMLTMALKVGTEPAWADIDPGTPGPVLAIGGGYVLLDNGEVWVVMDYWDGNPFFWERMEPLDPPISVSQIKFYDGQHILSTSGEYWVFDHTDWPNGDWVNLGTPPGAPTQGTNWSQLKTQFGR